MGVVSETRVDICLCLFAGSRFPRRDRLAFLEAAQSDDEHSVRQELDQRVLPDDVYQIGDRTAWPPAAINGYPTAVQAL